MAKKNTPKPTAPADPASIDVLLAQASQVATKAAKKPAKKEAPIVYLDDAEEEVVDSVRDMIRLLVLNGEVTEVLKVYKKTAQDLLFTRWCGEVWETRSVPDNPRIAIRKEGTSAIDMSVIFQVKHRSDGIKLPDSLKPGQTVQDHILAELMSPVVGLSAANATKLVHPQTGEITVKEEFYLPDFNSMLQSEDAEVKSGASKIFRLLMGQDVDAVTAKERAKILLKRQVVRVNEGIIDRAFTYCDDAEQLERLLRYIGVGLATSNPQFAEGDRRSEKIARMQQTVQEFLGADLPE